MKPFVLLLALFLFSIYASADPLCGNWEAFKDEVCIKIFDTEKLQTFDDAEKSCLQLDNSSTLLTIHSSEEQEFVSNFLFNTHNIVDNVWIGLRNISNKFKWIDNSDFKFTNWATGSPSNKTNYDCVQMLPESSQKGKWVDEPCSKKNLVVCQKTPTVTIDFLHKKLLETSKMLLETSKMLLETQEKLETYFKNSLNEKWLNYKLFTDTDGKHKAFFLPINEKSACGEVKLEEASEICAKFNGTLVEVQTWQKQLILESYLGQLGFLSPHCLGAFWLNGRKDSSGKWKWRNSGRDIAYVNWDQNQPTTNAGEDNLYVGAYEIATFGKWKSYSTIGSWKVLCEFVVDI